MRLLFLKLGPLPGASRQKSCSHYFTSNTSYSEATLVELGSLPTIVVGLYSHESNINPALCSNLTLDLLGLAPITNNL